jgi:hypothetical protein
MRHFNAFTGVSREKRSMAFAQKLLKHAHATVRDYMGAGSVFHLFSRLVYGPIDKDNVRNRRRHSFDYIRTRLVQMDFLLENPGHDFLETESDKVNLFCESLAVPKDVLPAKVYDGGAEAIFGAAKLRGPRRNVEHAKALQMAEESFKQPLESDVSSEVLRYFEVRRKWENHEYVVPVAADFEFLNEARRRFHGERFEGLYQAWITGRIVETELRLEFSQLAPPRTVFFDTYLVRNGRSPLDEKIRKRVNGA